MRLHAGYVPLCDAAPLIVAADMRFGREEGLEIELSAEPSWATLRDRLALGHLDAAHMLAPLALASALGLSGPPSDLAVPLSMSLNGNAVTVGDGLWEAMAPENDDPKTVARAFARVAEERYRTGRPLTLGTVHPYSSHTYQIRRFCGLGSLDPEAIRLVAMPPQRSVEALARGIIDGFCAGAPWNSVAVAAGLGRIAVLCCEIAPDYPEKVLAVSARIADGALPLVRAVARAGQWCADPANRTEIAHVVTQRGRIEADAAVIERCLSGDLLVDDAGTRRSAPDYLRFDGHAQKPAAESVARIVADMRAAGQFPTSIEPRAAAAVYRPDILTMAGLRA